MLESVRERVAGWILPKQVSNNIEIPDTVMAALQGRTPPSRGTLEIIRAYKEIPSLRAIVQRIAEPVAATEWTLHVQTTGTNGSRRFVRNAALQRAGFEKRNRILKSRHDDIQEIESHPMLDLLEFGNPKMPGFAVMQVAQSHIELKGESFLAKHRNAVGQVDALWPLPPHWVVDTPDTLDDRFEVRVRGKTDFIDVADMIWTRDPDPENPYGRGTGVAESLGDELDSDENAQNFISSFFHNSALPAAIVSLKGASKPSVAAIRAKWEQDLRGRHRTGRIHFTNAEHTLTQLGQTFQEMNLVELRKFLRSVVRETFGLPPEVIGIIENSNRATIESAIFILMLLVVVPRAERWRGSLQRDLAPEWDDRLIVGFESPVPEDKTHRLETMKAAPWAYTRAEWREVANFDSHGDVDEVYLQPLGLFERPVEGASPQPLPGDEPAVAMLPVGDKQHVLPARIIRAFGLDDIGRTLEALRPERLSEPTSKLWDTELATWADDVLQGVGSNVAFDLLNPVVVDHLRGVTSRMEGITDTTREALRKTLVEGVQAGDGVRQLRARVGGVFTDAKTWRLERIARTEVHRSASFGTNHAFRVSGVVERRRWIAKPDDSAFDGDRPHHLTSLQGQERNLREPFEVNGFTAMHPGGFGVAKHDINCRCVQVAVIDSERSVKQQDEPDRQERERSKWEARTRSAMRGGFNEQERDVLEEIQDFR